ncbi:hypothetical protein INT47_009257 [Mucor saturninus]|uniref:Uncharacterized protein n=1 Tax=Mucor saturninus TaxID=64648 RepID=A0A8H7QWB9_9FUNG|nr:hypothetical protein INT47_009257 [Mucor saturninus]
MKIFPLPVVGIIVFGGLKGTLGEKALSVGYLAGWKSKCVAFLSRNVIIDFSNTTQLKAIGIKLAQLNNRFRIKIKGVERDIQQMNSATKKIENRSSGETFLKDAEAFVYANSNERGVDQMVNKPVLFHNTSQNQFSETSFLVKFWGPVIELFFNPNEYFIQWGDTISQHVSVSNLYFKLDFRIIVKDFDNNEFDITTGELARHSSTTPSKMYRDFLKSALTTKSMIKNIEEMVIEFSKTPSIAMSNIRKGRKKNTMVKTTDIDDYISTAIACPDSENEDKSKDKDSDDED